MLVAVSGGLDSVVLLDLFVRAQPRWQWELAVAYVEHDWRSVSEAAFVVRLATDYGLPCFVRRIAARPVAERRGRGYEDAARHERYAALHQLAKRWGAEAVVTGHHRDDQTETVLYRLLRGTSPGGLGGMAPVRALARGSDIDLVRPLLPFSRAQLAAEADKRRLVWCEDASNADLRFLRNRIRHEVVPLLEAVRPGAARQLANLADLARRDEAYWQQALAALPPDWCQPEPAGGYSVAIQTLAAMVEPLRRRCWERLLQSVGPRAVTSHHVRQLEALLHHHGPGAALHLPHGWIARREYERLHIVPVAATPASAPASQQLTVGRAIAWADGTMTAELVSARPPAQRHRSGQWPDPAQQRRRRQPAAATVWLDATKLPAEKLCIRSRLPGDRLRPAGGVGTKKLQDVFTEAKVPSAWRDTWPVVCRADTGEVVWVTGLAVAEPYVATADCQQTLALRWLPTV